MFLLEDGYLRSASSTAKPKSMGLNGSIRSCNARPYFISVFGGDGSLLGLLDMFEILFAHLGPSIIARKLHTRLLKPIVRPVMNMTFL